MTNYIENSFQSQLTNTLRMAVQQNVAKVAPLFLTQSFSGEGAQVADYVKKAPAPNKNVASKSDTTYSDIDTTRRWIYPDTYDDYILVDSFDKLKTLNDPSNGYRDALIKSAARQKDDVAIAAFFADAKTGKAGATTTVFPTSTSTNVVAETVGAAAATGLNVEKLLQGRQFLMAYENDLDYEELYCVIGAKQERNLQNEIKATNADYNAMYDINTGKLTSLFGIKFIHSERLLTDGTYRRIPLFCKSGMQMGIWKDIEVTVHDKVASKRDNPQVGYKMMIGAARLEEEKVIEIKCAE